MHLPRALLDLSSKKDQLRRKFLIFQEMELSDFSTKKFLTFSQKRAFLIFRETVTPKKIIYILENGNHKKIFISGARKIRK